MQNVYKIIEEIDKHDICIEEIIIIDNCSTNLFLDQKKKNV